jgi:DNA replication protein DnaC
MSEIIGGYCFGREYDDAHMSKIEQDPEHAIKMLAWMKKPDHMFYFCGNIGNGKTYFAAAWYHYLIEQKKSVRVFTEPGLYSHLKLTMANKMDPHFELKRLCETEYFILDDMGSTRNSDWQGDMLLDFVNHRINNHLPTLITSNLTKAKLMENFDARLVSRIYAARNCIIETNGPDRRQMQL